MFDSVMGTDVRIDRRQWCQTKHAAWQFLSTTRHCRTTDRTRLRLEHYNMRSQSFMEVPAEAPIDHGLAGQASTNPSYTTTSSNLTATLPSCKKLISVLSSYHDHTHVLNTKRSLA